MSKAIDLKSDDFSKEVLESKIPVLVDFWASWCMPCKMMSPVLDELAEDLENKVKIVKINTEDEENQSLAAEYNIQSIPNLKLFKDSKLIGEFVGMQNKEALKMEIEKLIN